MKRREFITLLGGAAAGWPLAAQAQRQGAAVIGLLNAQSGGGASESQIAELRRGLEDGGFVEGRNLQIEYRSDAYHIRDLAADLVKRQVAVIICIGDAEAVEAAQERTSTIPIVLATDLFDIDAYDLVVKAVNWPKANATGYIWSPSFAFVNKRFELLSKLVPNAKSVGYLDNLVNSGSRNVAPYGPHSIDTESNVIKRSLGFATGAGRKLLVFEEAFTERRIDSAFEDMAREGVEMLVVSPDAYLSTRQGQIADLAKRYEIPAITGWHDLVAQGGLISYAPSEGFRQAGLYAARILKGAKPGDLPIQQLSQFELFINLKTAKTLGLIVPQELLAIADGVIE